MPRSSNIYLVTDAEGPLATFTVKHECQSWLDTYGAPGMQVRRMPDGPRRYPEDREAGRGVDVTEQFAPFLTRNRMNILMENLYQRTASSVPTTTTNSATAYSLHGANAWASLYLQQPVIEPNEPIRQRFVVEVEPGQPTVRDILNAQREAARRRRDEP